MKPTPPPAPALALPPLSHAEAREIMVAQLVSNGTPREEAEEIAMRCAVRASRREGFKL